ncbi:hypothetical protein [Paenibacillus albus]|uniref:Uncharacterized protein n=1 Tax=Paenibacillus albus TaxID=2495582 RepID=A0A3Q8X611_9BACL|nr:hypothetical protein [Paenibacillus albus]AZN41304.1 hypothetical protein EJC50_17730 [Paenibacillus albus]
MSNYIPYLVLIIASLLILTIMMIREWKSIIIVSHLSYAGMSYVFEVIILIVLEGYTYSPGLLKNSYLDSMFGATVSNFCTVPAIAILIAYYQLRLRWIIIAAVFLGGVDVLFVYLNIYQHLWWSSSYTVVTLVFFFWFSRMWMIKVLKGNRVFQYITLLMYTFCITDSVFFMYILSGWRRYHLGLYKNPLRDDVMLTVIMSFCITLILVNTVFWSKKHRFTVFGCICIGFAQYFLYKTGHLSLYVAPWLYASAYAATLLLVAVFCRLGLKSLLYYGNKQQY